MSMPLPAADRMRAYRQRKRTGGTTLADVPVGDEVALIEFLIACNLLGSAEREDRKAVARACGRVLDIAARERGTAP